MLTLLTAQELREALASMSGWGAAGNEIRKTYTCKTFAAAVGFINAVAIRAETLDHHPDLFLHGWNKVEVILSTHSAGGITQNDITLAGEIDKLGF